MAIPPYASILNRRLVVPSTRASYLAIEEHFMIELMLPMLKAIRVDEKWYLTAYPDVKSAIERGVVPGAKAHYCRFGYFEHRMPHRVTVDESWYVKEYPDVKDAVAKKLFISGQAHFELLGYKEGRFPYKGFHLETEAEIAVQQAHDEEAVLGHP